MIQESLKSRHAKYWTNKSLCRTYWGGGGVVNQRTWSICLDSVEFLAMVMGLTFCVNLFPVIMLVGTGVQIRSDQFSSV